MPIDEPDISISPDWMSSDWNHLLPRQALWLHMLAATATLNGIDGGLETLIAAILPKRFDADTGGLDGPVWWSFPDEEFPDEDARLEQLALDTKHQIQFEDVMARAGRPLPGSVRELAELMADLGVLDHKMGETERWRAPTALPLVAEKLPVSQAFAEQAERDRWHHLHEGTAQAIIRYIVETLNSPDTVKTSLVQLAAAIDREPADVRFGLAVLVDDGDFGVEDDQGNAIDPERLDERSPTTVKVDWDRFGETRFGIQFVPPEEGRGP